MDSLSWNCPWTIPRVRPLLDELAVEYDSRYGDLFGRGSAAEELNRYPAEEFQAPDGALLIIRENGESVAGGAFRRLRRPDRRVQADLDPLGAPAARAGPPGPGRAGTAGRRARLRQGLPHHRAAPARGQTPVPEHRLHATLRPGRRSGNHRAPGVHEGPSGAGLNASAGRGARLGPAHVTDGRYARCQTRFLLRRTTPARCLPSRVRRRRLQQAP